MKNRYIFAALLLSASATVISCSKEMDEVQTPSRTQAPTKPVAELSPSQKAELRVAFAKTLAKAVMNQQVRQVINKESSKYFDKDYDVLLNRVKGTRLDSRNTLYSYLDSLSQPGTDLDKITKNLPLLNIYVASYLNSGNWDTKNQIPVVAVRDAEDRLIAFNQEGQQMELNPKEEPLAPIIVVKDNERVVAEGPLAHSIVQQPGDFLFEDGSTKYYFLDNEYNGLVSNRKVSLDDPSAPDAKVVQAFEISATCPLCAQRDWIYYNINVAGGQTEGALNSNFEEAVTAMRFENLGGFDTVGGWDEGNYEFWINGFFGGTSPTNLTPSFKNLSARATDLVEYHTERRSSGGIRGFFGDTYPVKVADSPKEYTFGVPVKFVPWDMKKYGDTWGMTIEEYDPTVNETLTYKHSTTVGTNYKLDASTGTDIKVGGSLGGSTTTVKESTAEYKSQTGNDRLGFVTVSFKSPVITRRTPAIYVIPDPNTVWTNELSSGTLILSFEAVRVR